MHLKDTKILMVRGFPRPRETIGMRDNQDSPCEWEQFLISIVRCLVV